MGRIARALGLQTLSNTGPVGDYGVVSPPARARHGADPMGLPAFYRGVVVLTNMAAPLKVDAWRWGAAIPSSLVARPDPWMTRRRFMALTIAGLVLHGNAYWLKQRGPDGSVVGLRVADSGHPVFDDQGGLGYLLYIQGKPQRVSASEVEHLRFFEVPGQVEGLGPVQACRSAVEGIAAVREYSDKWFDSGDAVSGILSTDQRLDPDLRREYKKAWNSRDPEDGPGPGVKVMGSGLTYTPYFLKPADAQWLEAQSWGVLDIARLLGLPGDYLLAAVEGSSLTYSNLEMIDTSFVKRTLLPDYLQPIEEALGNVLPNGQTARFDLSDFLRPDAKTRADIDAIYIDKGVYPPEYVQRRDGISLATEQQPAKD